MRNYKELFKSGNNAQLEKLKENEHKSGFDNLSLSIVIARLLEETKELEEAKNTYDIRRELADVANFAHMGILTCDKILKNHYGKKKSIIRRVNSLEEI